MDWQAFIVTIEVALATCLLLIPLAIPCARILAYGSFRGKWLIEVLVLMPLILPPTVIGYYLLQALGIFGPIGKVSQMLLGRPLAFHWDGLVIASIVFNLPFAIYPIQRAFCAIPQSVLEAAQFCGLRPVQIHYRIELPLIWPGILTALILVFTHTLGEFGVVLMVGGSIPGETRTLAIAIYDSVQSFDYVQADTMALFLLVFSAAVIYCLGFLGKLQYGRSDGPHIV